LEGLVHAYARAVEGGSGDDDMAAAVRAHRPTGPS